MNVKEKKKGIVHYLPVYGCLATGIIYASIGVFAILSFLRLKEGGADENSFLALLSGFVAGKILVIIIIAGTLSYIAWRFYEAVKDPYNYGNNAAGLAKRSGIAVSTLADILILYSAVRYLLQSGTYTPGEQLEEQRETAARILDGAGGEFILSAIGIVVIITAVVQLWYGISRGYHERLEIEKFRPVIRKAVHISAIYGYAARAIILGITGFFYVRAGVKGNAGEIVDTDKAFDFIGDHIGHFWFIAVAAGTILYGVFMFALAAAYDTDSD